MKIPRKIKEMPWPEPFRSETKQHFRITLQWPVIDHERLLVATFLQNVNRSSRPDFRLICSKKQPAAAILFKGEARAKRKDLNTASCVNVRSAYPEISEQDEKALGKWLRAESTQNHFLPELYEWVNEAIAAEILRERDARGEIRDEDVELCPEELPEGLERFILGAVLPNDKVLIYSKGNTRGICYSCGHKVRARRERFTQGNLVRCPDCGEVVACYLDTSDRFKVDYVENIASIQKGTDGMTIFIRQWHLKRDKTALWLDIPGHLEEVCRYAIRGNRVAKWQREGKENWMMEDMAKVKELWSHVQAGSIQEKDVPALARSMVTTEHIWYAMGHASVHRILQYIEKNVEKERARRKIEKEEATRLGRSYWGGRPFDTPGTYRDYLKDCIALKMNLDDREVLFPPDLNAAHARTISQVKYKKNEAKRELFSRECHRLKWMEWEKDGLLIRLPEDAAELIAEGEYLHHCVAGYADRMADGKTTILLIRRAEAPDVPFYTLEWHNGKVQQCRTIRNADYRDDERVRLFVEEWTQKIARKKKKKAATSAA